MAVPRSPFADTDFVWGPPRSALCWVDVGELGRTRGGFEGLGMPGRYLTTKEADPLGAQPVYQPMRPTWGFIGETFRKSGSPVLFRRFVQLEPTEDAILEWARRFGMLTLGEPIHAGKDEVRVAEPLALWRAEIVTMRRMVEVWDAVRESKLDKLLQLVKMKSWRRRKGTGLHYQVSYQGSRLLYAVLRPARGVLAESSVSWRALFLIQKVVNERLADHTAPLLSAASDHPPSRNSGGDRLRIDVWPVNLLGALWLQFARAIEGDREYRRCAACGEWLEIARGSYTKRARFCRTVCRVNFHRGKRWGE